MWGPPVCAQPAVAQRGDPVGGGAGETALPALRAVRGDELSGRPVAGVARRLQPRGAGGGGLAVGGPALSPGAGGPAPTGWGGVVAVGGGADRGVLGQPAPAPIPLRAAGEGSTGSGDRWHHGPPGRRMAGGEAGHLHGVVSREA